MTTPHLGEILSVLAALIWAISVVLFRISGRELKPLARQEGLVGLAGLHLFAVDVPCMFEGAGVDVRRS